MTRTFGIGPRAQKGILTVWNRTLRPKSSVNPKEKCKNNASGKHDRFRTVFGSMDDHFVPDKESVF